MVPKRGFGSGAAMIQGCAPVMILKVLVVPPLHGRALFALPLLKYLEGSHIASVTLCVCASLSC